MTGDQARKFAESVDMSDDPIITKFNGGVRYEKYICCMVENQRRNGTLPPFGGDVKSIRGRIERYHERMAKIRARGPKVVAAIAGILTVYSVASSGGIPNELENLVVEWQVAFEKSNQEHRHDLEIKIKDILSKLAPNADQFILWGRVVKALESSQI
jgi:hypothetical protein